MALLFDPANAERLARELSQMRGAVMKIGQLLSMEANELLPPEAVEIFAGLRENAHQLLDAAELERRFMPGLGTGLAQTLQIEFNSRPFAAASIGQVHEARDQRRASAGNQDSVSRNLAEHRQRCRQRRTNF